MYICPCFNPETSECTIYSIRPLDCQIYPFALMYNQDRTQVVLGVDMICPYGEEEIQTEAFQHYINYMADYLESDSVVETIAVNWQLIGSYQGNSGNCPHSRKVDVSKNKKIDVESSWTQKRTKKRRRIWQKCRAVWRRWI